jgi:hypothetical protein
MRALESLDSIFKTCLGLPVEQEGKFVTWATKKRGAPRCSCFFLKALYQFSKKKEVWEFRLCTERRILSLWRDREKNKISKDEDLVRIQGQLSFNEIADTETASDGMLIKVSALWKSEQYFSSLVVVRMRIKHQDLLKRRAVTVHARVICNLGGIHSGCKCEMKTLCQGRKLKGEYLWKKITSFYTMPIQILGIQSMIRR